jgi:hypothetical protein
MQDERTIEPGSFSWYMYRSGDFVKTVASAIQLADEFNLDRLSNAYPQMVAAHACSDWDKAPKGYKPEYDGDKL